MIFVTLSLVKEIEFYQIILQYGWVGLDQFNRIKTSHEPTWNKTLRVCKHQQKRQRSDEVEQVKERNLYDSSKLNSQPNQIGPKSQEILRLNILRQEEERFDQSP